MHVSSCGQMSLKNFKVNPFTVIYNKAPAQSAVAITQLDCIAQTHSRQNLIHGQQKKIREVASLVTRVQSFYIAVASSTCMNVLWFSPTTNNSFSTQKPRNKILYEVLHETLNMKVFGVSENSDCKQADFTVFCPISV